MGNILTQNKQYRHLEFHPHDNIQYQEYDDIAGLQEQINNLNALYKTILDKRLKNIESDIDTIKRFMNENGQNITRLSEISNMHTRDLESLLNNDKVIIVEVKEWEKRITMNEEKVQYDQFINSGDLEEYKFKSIEG